MEIILFQPEIPQNTGNVVRTCSVTGAKLTLVRPLGFSLKDRWLKRAGLDYWNEVDINIIDDLEGYLEGSEIPFHFFSSHSKTSYSKATYTPTTRLIFGSETKGLPTHFHEKWPSHFLKIPMKEGARCLNLANAAAIILYEALRQTDFTLLTR